MQRLAAALLVLAIPSVEGTAQVVERRAPFVADISLPADWTIDESREIQALVDSLQAWGDSLNADRYRFASTVLMTYPVLRARGANGSAEGAVVSLNYVPTLQLRHIDTVSAVQFAEMAAYRCESARRQVEQLNGSLECDAPTERRIGDWRALVAMQRLRVPSSGVHLRRADVVVPMHGALFTAVISVEANEGDVARLEQIVGSIRPLFTRAGAGEAP